ncbi:MAG: hypothetical protein NZ578_00135 [Candidatus Binatia bacterium]|nr:hypothetical protein [Candidatus Binatia bacterium]
MTVVLLSGTGVSVLLSTLRVPPSLAVERSTAVEAVPLHAARNLEDDHALPEGSGSVIESLTWRLAGQDPAMLRSQVIALIRQTAEAVIIRDSADHLVTSLPTSALTPLRQALARLGELRGPAEVTSAAPTTLLRIQFVQSP